MTPLPTLIKLSSPLGDEKLRFAAMQGTEQISRPFEYELTALSPDRALNPKSLLGRPVSIALELSDKGQRHFHGIVTRMAISGAQGRMFTYSLRINPQLWLLSRRTDTRIFQKMTVPQILRKVLTGIEAITFDLHDTYPVREYCVQYQETDLDFASRLMEQEGIFYFFRHTAGAHLMMVSDRNTVHLTAPGFPTFRYRPQEMGAIAYEAITEWLSGEQIQPGRVTLNDYWFEEPARALLFNKLKDRKHTGSSMEHYEPLVDDYKDEAGGRRYAELRLEELQAPYTLASGAGTMSALAAGNLFSLTDHPREDQNREYIVLATQFRMRHHGYESNDDDTSSYHCSFSALDSRETFRPSRNTPRPVVAGPLTAQVVGGSYQEICTDKYGRIKVQFHWDRLGRKDEGSSCWIRVAQPMAGNGFGALLLPRVGHEVVVEFLGGDPDRPLVTGSVYNGANATPYPLPNHDTVSTLKSRSTPKGGVQNFNELRFEDSKGHEYVFMQAEKDQLQLVKAKRITKIGTDEMLSIGRDRREQIMGEAHLDVTGDQIVRVGGDVHTELKGDALSKVKGEWGLTVDDSMNVAVQRDIGVKAGLDLHLKADSNGALESGINLHVKGGLNLVLEAGIMLTLRCGPSSITLGPSGVSVTGPLVLINSGGAPGQGQGAKPQKPSEPKPVEPPTRLKDPLKSR